MRRMVWVTMSVVAVAWVAGWAVVKAGTISWVSLPTPRAVVGAQAVALHQCSGAGAAALQPLGTGEPGVRQAAPWLRGFWLAEAMVGGGPGAARLIADVIFQQAGGAGGRLYHRPLRPAGVRAMGLMPQQATGTTELVSIAYDGTSANDYCREPAISADGRFVAFYTDATNIVPGDTNGTDDVFVRDRQAGTTERVSLASDGSQANGWSGGRPSVSDDGRFVAFCSMASNLVPGDTNGVNDVFVRDRLTGTTERVNVASDGSQADGRSGPRPSISGDGRFVAFSSEATNLVPGDTNRTEDVFVRDRLTGRTERVSVASDGQQANGFSSNPSISADGRFVAFESGADNLVPGDTNAVKDIFVHDRQTGVTERVSVATGGGQADLGSEKPSISADGRFVAFRSWADNLVPGDTNGVEDIFVYDRQTGTTQRVSVASDGSQANTASTNPCISADGPFVAFQSAASNLVPGDTNGRDDIFVRDLLTGTTERVSVANDGNQALRACEYPAISADGRFVAFQSSDNLVPIDTNVYADIYVRDRLGSSEAKLLVTHDIPRDLYVDGPCQCMVLCYNAGGVPLTDVQVKLGLPQGFSVENIHPIQVSVGAIGRAKPTQGIQWVTVVSIDTLPVGESLLTGSEFTLVPPDQLPDPPTVTLTLHQQARAGQRTIEDEMSFDVVVHPKTIVLEVDKWAPRVAFPDRDLVYFVSFRSLGTDLQELVNAYGQEAAKTIAVMEDRLPLEVNFVSMDPEGVGQVSGHRIRWYLDKVAENIRNGELSVSVRTHLAPDAYVGTTLVNKVNLLPLPDPPASLPIRYENPQATVETQVLEAPIPNHMYVSPEEAVPPNTRLSYSIEYENEGPTVVQYVKVQTRLDQALDDTSLETSFPHPVYDPTTRTLTWEFRSADLQPRDPQWLHYSARVKPDVADGTQIKAQARIWFDQQQPLDTNEVSSEVRRQLLLCDFNHDGVVNAADLALFIVAYRNYHATLEYNKLYDVFPFTVTNEGEVVRQYDGRIDYRDANTVLESARPWK